jgi:alkylation response protein AidB-like acyl-CoA dehydrogenase
MTQHDWIRNGQKKWIGNATLADRNVLWASLAVRGFAVARDNPGCSVANIHTKMALHVVQKGFITLENCRVPEAGLQNASTFRETARVPRIRRAAVVCFAVGWQMGAYEHGLRYAGTRVEFSKHIAGFAGPGAGDSHARQRYGASVDDAALVRLQVHAGCWTGTRRLQRHMQGVVKRAATRGSCLAAWHPLGEFCRAARRRCQGHLFLRGHACGEGAHRR